MTPLLLACVPSPCLHVIGNIVDIGKSVNRRSTLKGCHIQARGFNPGNNMPHKRQDVFRPGVAGQGSLPLHTLCGSLAATSCCCALYNAIIVPPLQGEIPVGGLGYPVPKVLPWALILHPFRVFHCYQCIEPMLLCLCSIPLSVCNSV